MVSPASTAPIVQGIDSTSNSIDDSRRAKQSGGLPGYKRMAKEMRCADVGMDCDFVARADSTDELMQQVAAQAAEAHGITEVSEELAAQVQSVIRETD